MNTKSIIKNTCLLLIFLTIISCSPDQIEEIDTQNISSETFDEGKMGSVFRRNNFYTPPPSNIKRVVFTGSTSADLNLFINQNKRDGAIIEIPQNTYTWGKVVLKSNIHLEIAAGTIIQPDLNRGAIFNIGASGNGERLQNVSIISKDGRFTIDMCDSRFTNQFIAAARVGRVDNFRLANFDIKDRRSILNSILMIHVSGASERKPGAKNGIIENISQTGSHTGYGLVQTYNCSNVLFKNLRCEGGITLRLETDDRSMKNDVKNGTKDGGVKDIFADGIHNTRGLSSLMLSPHFAQNGKVTARRITSNSSGFTIRYDEGTLSIFDAQRAFPLTDAGKIQFQNFVKSQFSGFSGNAFRENAFKRNNGTQWAVNLSPEILDHPNRSQYIRSQIGNLRAGKFVNPTATNVEAKYGTKAKLKQKHLKFVPCNQWNKMTDPGSSFGLFRGFEYIGPSGGISIGDGVRITNQRWNNFPSGFIQNITDNTQPKCSNSPNSIQQVSGSYPNCN
ncbi:hypothetical protein [Aquimarina algicola]|uniref:Right-handed parallel beta-helix repeat-containing protein n=1 Tax=Aquimarina algicola TaxID=2589995 RepID=A0A504J1Y0_9FLAO|nr:hypothetical protein [Aquimarina algicola]TPN84424.1 hypothetical protein FHK87_15935 [Aquimarina algicola]